MCKDTGITLAKNNLGALKRAKKANMELIFDILFDISIN